MTTSDEYEQQTDFAHYHVVDMTYDGRPARMLYGDDESSQAGMALDDNPELLFDYIQRLYEAAASINPQTVLCIGGGAYTLPKAILGLDSVRSVTVVEIDPALEAIARDHFGLPKDPRLTIVEGDGRDFVEQNEADYDLIIIDAFSGYTIPRQLITSEAVAAYRQNLSTDGIVLLNFISAYSRWRTTNAHRISATFETVFEHVDIYPASLSQPFLPTERNLILAAYDGPDRDLHDIRPARLEPLTTDSSQAYLDMPPAI